jgi:hypothetical protein
LTRKKPSPSKSHGASMSAPATSTPRITTPDRSAPTNRATQVRVDELRSPQVVGPGERCHGFSSSSVLSPLAHDFGKAGSLEQWHLAWVNG